MRKPIRVKISKLYSLQFVIAIFSILIAMIPMVYSWFSIYGKYSTKLIDNSKVYSSQIMDQLTINVEEYLRRGIMAHVQIEGMLEDYNKEITGQFLNRLNVFYSTRNDMVSISIFSEDGKVIASVPQNIVKKNYSINKEKWFEQVINEKALFYISEPHVQNIYQSQYDWVISYIKTVNVMESGQLSKCILVIDMSLKPLDQLCKNLNLGDSGYVYIINEKNEILYHPQQELIFANLKEEVLPVSNEGIQEISLAGSNDDYFLIKKSLNFVDWNIIGKTYIKNMMRENEKIAKEIYITIPFIIFILIMLSWYVSGKITLPIKELESSMKKVQKGDFSTQIHIKNGEKEVVELANAFNVMVKKMDYLIHENQREQEAKRKSELNALQAQINPHFLYNTLDSIMWMAEQGASEEVVNMVTALARLFRISISKGCNIITVEEEMEHAKNYLMIEKIRYKDRFTYEIHADEEVLKLKTIKLILQPIIENAIYHGIEYLVDEGHIVIRAYCKDEALYFSVEDNGLGMDEEIIHKIMFEKECENVSKKGGVGIRNIQERIRLTFGEEYGLYIQSVIDEGTTVKIKLPIVQEELNEKI